MANRYFQLKTQAQVLQGRGGETRSRVENPMPIPLLPMADRDHAHSRAKTHETQVTPPTALDKHSLVPRPHPLAHARAGWSRD